MNQPTPPRGNFVAFLNRDKQPGDKRPLFVDGKIAKPGTEQELPLTLWAFEYTDKATSEVLTGFGGSTGNVSPDASATDQVHALLASRPADGAVIETAGLKLNPGQVVAFVNKPKEGVAPNPKDKTHYGVWNPGDGTPPVQISIWLGKDRYGRAILTGNTQYPLPAKSEAEAAPEKAPVKHGAPKTLGPAAVKSRGSEGRA